MKFKNGLKAIAVASSLFFAANLTSCSTTYVGKHRIGNVYREIKKPKHKYAILILGSASNKDRLDNFLDKTAFKIYNDLKDLGFSDENINFLASSSSSKISEDVVDSVFTDDMFKRVCSQLSDKMTKEDMLLFYYIGHGDKIKKDYGLLAGYGTVKLEFLETELKKLEHEYGIMIIDACYSGNFAKQFGKKNRVGVSNACENQLPWMFSKFSPYLMDALKGEKEADKNKDNRVSLEEAVYYATEKDPWSIKNDLIKQFFPQPQIYYEEIDPSEVFLKE